MRSKGLSRWRVALRFLIRSLDLRAAGFTLALLAVTVGAAVTTTTFSLRADLAPKMMRELRSYGPNLLVSPPLTADGIAPDLDERWVDGIAGRAPAGVEVIVSPILLTGGTADGEPVTLVGSRFEPARALAASWRIEGAWPDDDGCLVGRRVARDLHLSVGEPLQLRVTGGSGGELTIRGIAETGEGEDDQVLVPLTWLQAASGRAGRVSLAALGVAGDAGAVEAFAASLEAAAPGAVEARPLLQVSRAQGALLGKLSRMMALITAVVLILAAMCAMTTLMSIVVERESEIGLMRSMGASDGEVLLMLLGEATILGLLGGTLGLGLGWLDARWIGMQLFGTSVPLRAAVIPVVLGITLALCWLAVILPVRRALRVQPAAALRS